MPEFIGSIRLTPAAAQPGQPVLVEVLAPDGSALGSSVPVMVNGIRGARQYVQFNGPGTFTVAALAGEGAATERAAADVVVTASSWPSVAVPQGAGHVALPDAIRRLPMLTATAAALGRLPYHVQFAASDTAEFTANLTRLFRADTPGAPAAVDQALAVAAYHWDFGDGATASTNLGLVDHDFGASLATDEEHRLFDITCTVETAGAGSFEVKRTLSVVNAYAICRNRGVIAPPVISESHARKVLTAFEATIQVRNLETFPLTLTSRRVSYEQGDSESVLDPETLAAPLELAPMSATTVSLRLPFNQVPADSTGIGIVFIGSDPDGRRVHVETHLDVALPDHRATGLMLRDIGLTRSVALGVDRMLAQLPAQEQPADPGRGETHDGGIFAEFDPTSAQEILVHHRSAGGMASQNPVMTHGLLLPHTASHGAGLANADRRLRGADGAQRHATLPAAVADRVGAASTLSGLRPVETALRSLAGGAVDRANDFAGIAEVAALDEVQRPMLRELADFATGARLSLPIAREGENCDPDNLPDVEDGWSCQIKRGPDGHDEMVDWHRHAGFANARKGNLLLAPGGPAGFIGGLLRQVNPAQHYSHIGILTRNHDMVTHSTFSEDRLNDNPNGSISILGLVDEPAPTDGFVPNVLKYGWPGVVTQWIGGAVDGGSGKLADLANMPAPGQPEAEIDAKDPDTGKVYAIKPFNRYAETSFANGQWEIVPPLIVKPDPLEETAEVRARLHAVADAALAEAGKSHYRFYCYSDGAIALTDTAPEDAGWAKGTYPSVCSVFIWRVLRQAGVQMEGPGGAAGPGDLEPLDVSPGGAEVGESSRTASISIGRTSAKPQRSGCTASSRSRSPTSSGNESRRRRTRPASISPTSWQASPVISSTRSPTSATTLPTRCATPLARTTHRRRRRTPMPGSTLPTRERSARTTPSSGTRHPGVACMATSCLLPTRRPGSNLRLGTRGSTRRPRARSRGSCGSAATSSAAPPSSSTRTPSPSTRMRPARPSCTTCRSGPTTPRRNGIRATGSSWTAASAWK